MVIPALLLAAGLIAVVRPSLVRRLTSLERDRDRQRFAEGQVRAIGVTMAIVGGAGVLYWLFTR